MPVLVQVGRKQGTDRSADTCCSSLHGGIRRMKKERESLPKSQEQTVTSEAGTLGGLFQIAAARTYFNIRRK